MLARVRPLTPPSVLAPCTSCHYPRFVDVVGELCPHCNSPSTTVDGAVHVEDYTREATLGDPTHALSPSSHICYYLPDADNAPLVRAPCACSIPSDGTTRPRCGPPPGLWHPLDPDNPSVGSHELVVPLRPPFREPRVCLRHTASHQEADSISESASRILGFEPEDPFDSLPCDCGAAHGWHSPTHSISHYFPLRVSGTCVRCSRRHLSGFPWCQGCMPRPSWNAQFDGAFILDTAGPAVLRHFLPRARDWALTAGIFRTQTRTIPPQPQPARRNCFICGRINEHYSVIGESEHGVPHLTCLTFLFLRGVRATMSCPIASHFLSALADFIDDSSTGDDALQIFESTCPPEVARIHRSRHTPFPIPRPPSPLSLTRLIWPYILEFVVNSSLVSFSSNGFTPRVNSSIAPEDHATIIAFAQRFQNLRYTNLSCFRDWLRHRPEGESTPSEAHILETLDRIRDCAENRSEAETCINDVWTFSRAIYGRSTHGRLDASNRRAARGPQLPAPPPVRAPQPPSATSVFVTHCSLLYCNLFNSFVDEDDDPRPFAAPFACSLVQYNIFLNLARTLRDLCSGANFALVYWREVRRPGTDQNYVGGYANEDCQIHMSQLLEEWTSLNGYGAEMIQLWREIIQLGPDLVRAALQGRQTLAPIVVHPPSAPRPAADALAPTPPHHPTPAHPAPTTPTMPALPEPSRTPSPLSMSPAATTANVGLECSILYCNLYNYLSAAEDDLSPYSAPFASSREHLQTFENLARRLRALCSEAHVAQNYWRQARAPDPHYVGGYAAAESQIHMLQLLEEWATSIGQGGEMLQFSIDLFQLGPNLVASSLLSRQPNILLPAPTLTGIPGPAVQNRTRPPLPRHPTVMNANASLQCSILYCNLYNYLVAPDDDPSPFSAPFASSHEHQQTFVNLARRLREQCLEANVARDYWRRVRADHPGYIGGYASAECQTRMLQLLEEWAAINGSGEDMLQFSSDLGQLGPDLVRAALNLAATRAWPAHNQRHTSPANLPSLPPRPIPDTRLPDVPNTTVSPTPSPAPPGTTQPSPPLNPATTDNAPLVPQLLTIRFYNRSSLSFGVDEAVIQIPPSIIVASAAHIGALLLRFPLDHGRHIVRAFLKHEPVCESSLHPRNGPSQPR
jgi:hypothetical protein